MSRWILLLFVLSVLGACAEGRGWTGVVDDLAAVIQNQGASTTGNVQQTVGRPPPTSGQRTPAGRTAFPASSSRKEGDDTTISLLLEDGEQTINVASYTGHSSTRMVEEVYAHVIERARKRPANRMGKLVYLRRPEPAGEDLPLGRGEC